MICSKSTELYAEFDWTDNYLVVVTSSTIWSCVFVDKSLSKTSAEFKRNEHPLGNKKDVVPVARLETFKALKFFRWRVLNFLICFWHS